MSQQTDARKLLVLHGRAMEAQGILGLLGECFKVHIARDLDEALARMRSEDFSAVLAETADFLPLERGIVSQQAAVILDTVGDGVCIVGVGGDLVWANRRVRELPQEIIARLCESCQQAGGKFPATGGAQGDRVKRFSILPDDGSYYEVICSPVRDRQGALRQVAAVVVNATTQRRQQAKLNAIDRAGRELVRLDDQAGRDAPQRLRLLEERIIRYSSDVLNYQHFEVMLLDGRSNRLESIICQGLDEEHRGDLFALADGNGISGYVAATGRSYICPDVQKDPRYLEGMANARSSLTVPLRLHDKVIGVLNVESGKPSAFAEEDRQFAEIFAAYVALALHMLNLLASERHTAHTQVSGSICAELSGPLNDIITEAGELMEDYIGHDDIRRRLSTIVDQANAARKCVQQLVASPQTGVMNVSATPTQADPVLAGKRVLVADDEELIRQTIRDVLVGAGCQVDTAADGIAAKALIGQGRYDLVVSDIKMPGCSGYEVFSAAKAACDDTKVILVTAFGYDPHHTIVRANRQGLSAVLMKPFKVRQLLDECRAAFGAKPA
jgi:CheY-like chemotaxis protein/GAF domain-containing protein